MRLFDSHHSGHRRGDTLIEVVFALAILASILVAITSGAITAWRTSRLAGERSQAAGLVTAQAEALKAYSYLKSFDTTFETEVNTAVNNGGCMAVSGTEWALQNLPSSCQDIGPDMGANKYSAKLSKVSPSSLTNCVIASKLCSVRITVSWKPLGSSTAATSSQIVTITEQ